MVLLSLRKVSAKAPAQLRAAVAARADGSSLENLLKSWGYQNSGGGDYKFGDAGGFGRGLSVPVGRMKTTVASAGCTPQIVHPGEGQQHDQQGSAAARAGVPNFGGRSPEGNPIESKWEHQKVPTPREMVELLNQHVVGQEQAKKVLSVGVHNHYKRVEHDMMRTMREEEAESTGKNGGGMLKIGKYPELKSTGMPTDEAERYMRLNLLARTDPAAVCCMLKMCLYVMHHT